MISSLEMQIDKSAIFEAREIANEITTAINDENLSVSNWRDSNEDLLSGL